MKWGGGEGRGRILLCEEFIPCCFLWDNVPEKICCQASCKLLWQADRCCQFILMNFASWGSIFFSLLSCTGAGWRWAMASRDKTAYPCMPRVRAIRDAPRGTWCNRERSDKTACNQWLTISLCSQMIPLFSVIYYSTWVYSWTSSLSLAWLSNSPISLSLQDRRRTQWCRLVRQAQTHTLCTISKWHVTVSLWWLFLCHVGMNTTQVLELCCSHTCNPETVSRSRHRFDLIPCCPNSSYKCETQEQKGGKGVNSNSPPALHVYAYWLRLPSLFQWLLRGGMKWHSWGSWYS